MNSSATPEGPGSSRTASPASTAKPRRPTCLARPNWLTNTGVSSSRLCWEYKLGFLDVKGVTVPTAVSIFPNELYQTPRAWAERAYPNLIYFNQVDEGNHFAAWQQPGIFTTEVRAAFRSLR